MGYLVRFVFTLKFPLFPLHAACTSRQNAFTISTPRSAWECLSTLPLKSALQEKVELSIHFLCERSGSGWVSVAAIAEECTIETASGVICTRRAMKGGQECVV